MEIERSNSGLWDDSMYMHLGNLTCYPNGKRIDLYPDAFSSPEALVRAIGHERMHIYQARTFGAPQNMTDLRLKEKAAYGMEDSFVKCWRANGGNNV